MINIVLRNKVNKDYALAEIAKLELDPDTPLELIVRPHKKQNTLSQKALFHVWCKVIANAFTNKKQELIEPDFIKTQIKRNFGLIDHNECPITGRMIPYLVSIAKYSRADLSETLLKTEVWCQEPEQAIDLSHKGCKDYAEYREAAL